MGSAWNDTFRVFMKVKCFFSNLYSFTDQLIIQSEVSMSVGSCWWNVLWSTLFLQHWKGHFQLSSLFYLQRPTSVAFLSAASGHTAAAPTPVLEKSLFMQWCIQINFLNALWGLKLGSYVFCATIQLIKCSTYESQVHDSIKR